MINQSICSRDKKRDGSKEHVKTNKRVLERPRDNAQKMRLRHNDEAHDTLQEQRGGHYAEC